MNGPIRWRDFVAMEVYNEMNGDYIQDEEVLEEPIEVEE